jgi:hypothetical protein
MRRARHTMPTGALPLEFAVGTRYESARLHYRVVNHAERWQSARPCSPTVGRGALKFLRTTHETRSPCSTTSN